MEKSLSILFITLMVFSSVCWAKYMDESDTLTGKDGVYRALVDAPQPLRDELDIGADVDRAQLRTILHTIQDEYLKTMKHLAALGNVAKELNSGLVNADEANGDMEVRDLRGKPKRKTFFVGK